MSDRVEPLVDALERWRGVENWAWSNGRPDLAELAGSALNAATEFADPATAAAARAAEGRLADAIAAVDDSALLDSSATAAARVGAVNAAIGDLLDVGASFEPPCPLDGLAAWS